MSMTRLIALLLALAGLLETTNNALAQAQPEATPTPIAALPANRAPLKPSAFVALPLGAVRPQGWLLQQLHVQAQGLTGHLDEIWPDVSQASAWLGGKGEAWERGPYYCDGMLPLAHLLGDPRLVAKANYWVEKTLTSQQANGQFGPASNNDWWPRMVMLKVLAMHYEASGDERVLPFMTRYFRFQLEELKKRPLEGWGKARGGDNALTAVWLYNLTGDAFLIELAQTILAQTDRWDELQGKYGVARFIPGYAEGKFEMLTHGVNNAMGLKTPAIYYELTGDAWLREATSKGMANLMEHHGQPNGMFAADEHLASTRPTAGTELCAVAEMMFSLEEAVRILGEPALGDQLELVAYNAFPATFKADMWAHQYDQQVNQVQANVAKRNWNSNGESSNIFGMEPNFGCCLANMHQGWPKLVKSLVMATADGGVALPAYGPCTATLKVGRNHRLTLNEQTQYPFDGVITLKLGLERGTGFPLAWRRTAKFPLVLRIPAWAEGAKLAVNGQDAGAPKAGSFHRLERTWSDGDTVTLTLPMAVRAISGHEGLVSVYRGPLLFGLKIGEQWAKIGGKEPHADWEVYPMTVWNYGLELDPQNAAGAFKVTTGPIAAIPFATEQAPVRLTAKGRRLPEWELENNSAGAMSGGPNEASTPLEDVTLIPYGSTHLRVAAFPLTKAKAGR